MQSHYQEFPEEARSLRARRALEARSHRSNTDVEAGTWAARKGAPEGPTCSEAQVTCAASHAEGRGRSDVVPEAIEKLNSS